MKTHFVAMMVILGLFGASVIPLWTADALAVTYYIRIDGGNGTQCTGLTNAPYPGSGRNQPCAWSHPFWALNASGNWKIAGGDTLIIHPGSYRMGFGAPNTGWCYAEGSPECHLPRLPSGPNPSSPTRILGAGWNQGCSNPPELWGTEKANMIVNLTNTSNAVIGCLEITDHSGCVEEHRDPAIRCRRDTPPFGDWALAGIYARDSSNVILRHLNIHGLANQGVHAGRLSNWTVENVRIAGNGWTGWDGDIYTGSACTGNMTFRRLTVEWNGCAERYPQKTPYGCWAQQAGGFGDGFGLAETGGTWLFEDSVFRWNTSDGLDLYYVRLPGSSIQVKRSQAYGNAGDQIKTVNNTHVENSLVVSNCGFFQGKPFTSTYWYPGDNCRAGGAGLSLNLRRNNRVSVVNCTIAGEGDTLIVAECDVLTPGDCGNTTTVTIRNNIFLGYPEFLTPGDRSAYIYFHPNVFGTVTTGYNLVYGANISNVGLTATDLQLNPLVVNANMETFDGRLQPRSAAINAGTPIGAPTHDILGRLRDNRPDIGAYEFFLVHGLRVLIEPALARISGAQWRRAGTQVWRNSNFIEQLPPGTYVIQFKPVARWRTPASRNAVVRTGQLTTIHALYTIPQGLRVMIEPPQARQAGALWRKVGTQVWRPHGFMERLAPGPHVVQFRPLPGWRNPPNRQVILRQNQMMTVQAQYNNVTATDNKRRVTP